MCPTYKVQVVDNASSDWIPSFSSLSFQSPDASIVKISDGKETMFCYYGDNTDTPFFVHQASPPGLTCTTYGARGFRCRKKGPYMFREGSLTLKPSQRALETHRPHKIHKIGHDPSPRDCRELLKGSNPARYAGSNVRQGDNFCFYYGSRYGKFTVTSESRRKPKTISIHFVIWSSAKDY